MTDVPDDRLLEQFARNGSEDAFALLVQRHIALVHSVAMRHTANAQHAQDITQAVFVILARKASTLGQKTVLPGWLYHTARLTAANLQRAEISRVRREQEAFMHSKLEEPTSDALWRELSPKLDEAMAGLGTSERDAVVLRYFQNKSMAEVGQFLGLTENTAQKRVGRALEKLRKFFTKRGVSSTTAIIAGAISANSVQAAPMALAKSVTAVAITKGAAASISTLTLIKGALKVMAWTKLKTAIVIGAAVVLTVGTTTAIIIYRHQTPSILSSTKELSDSDNALYASLTGMTPEQAARELLKACSQENWMETEKFLPPGLLTQHPSFGATFKSTYGGLEIVSLGHPFKSQVIIQAGLTYPGVFVPYEVRLKSGRIKKLPLAIRCDNPGKHWYFDGGM